MHAYAPSRGLELWKNTTAAIAGRGAALPSFHCADSGAEVCVRDYACEGITEEIRASAGMRNPFAGWSPGTGLGDTPGRIIAAVEEPASRLRAVWLYRICNPGFRAAQPHRFPDAWGLPFGEFVRWVWQQDPLGCDVLLRPQWAMIPEGAELYQLPSLLVERSEMALQCARLLYADDFSLWESASPIAVS